MCTAAGWAWLSAAGGQSIQGGQGGYPAIAPGGVRKAASSVTQCPRWQGGGRRASGQGGEPPGPRGRTAAEQRRQGGPYVAAMESTTARAGRQGNTGQSDRAQGRAFGFQRRDAVATPPGRQRRMGHIGMARRWSRRPGFPHGAETRAGVSDETRMIKSSPLARARAGELVLAN